MRNLLRVIQHCVGFFIILFSISGCKFGLDSGVGEESTRDVSSQAVGAPTLAEKLRPVKLTLSGDDQLNNRVCSSEITVWSRNSRGADAGVVNDHVIALSANHSGLFFLDSDCRQSTTSVIIRKRTSSATFYFRPNEVGAFEISAQDAHPSSEESLDRANMTMNSANQVPLVSAVLLSTLEEAATTGRISAVDANDDTLEYEVVVNPAHGSVSLNRMTGDFSYTPVKDYFGLDAFAVQVMDGLGVSAPAPVSITVVNMEDAPTSSPTGLPAATGFEDQDIDISYLQMLTALGAADADGDTLRFQIESVTSGTLKINGSNWSSTNRTLLPGQRLAWRPSANQNGTLAAFTCYVSDGKSLSQSDVTVRIAVTAVNDSPTISVSSNLSGAIEDTDFTVSYSDLAAYLNATDVDGGSIRFSIEQVNSGNLKVNGSAWSSSNKILQSGQSLVWRPSGNQNGLLSAFSVMALDASSQSSTLIATVVVQAVNDAPVAQGLSLTVDNLEGLVQTANLNGSDPDGDLLTYRLLGNRTDVVLLNASSGAFEYRVDPSSPLSDNFSYEVSDGTLIATGVVNITKREILPADTTFNNSGFLKLTGWGKATGVTYDLERNRYLIAGKQGADSYIVAIHSNGSLDPSFGNSGSVLIRGGSETSVNSIVMSADGIYLSGSLRLFDGATLDIFALKLDLNGTVVSTFGSSGWVVSDYSIAGLSPIAADDEGFASGKYGDTLYVAGSTRSSQGGRPTLVAISTANGAVLTQQTLPGLGTGTFKALAMDGARLALVGSEDSDTLVVSYRADLQSYEYSRTFDFGTNESVESIAIQGSDRWLIAGSLNQQVFVARVNPMGALDSSFGSGGIVTRPFGQASQVSATCLGIDSYRIWLLGDAQYSSGVSDRALLMMLGSSGQGTLSGSHTAGRSVSHGSSADMNRCVVHSDGRIFAVGAYDGQLTMMRHRH